MEQMPNLTSEKQPAVPSPLATGGAGGDFERHVGAACLATLLTGGMALLLPDAELATVSFQTRRLGWRTDDLLLTGTNRSAQRRRVALQVKLTFYVRVGDDDCVQTVCGAWDDFQNADLFVNGDRLGIIAGQTNQKASRGMRILLDVARASGDAADFFHRLGLPKYVSSDARDCLDVLREILIAHVGGAATEDNVWRFLRVLDFAVLDFDSPSSVAEGLVKSLLAGTCNGPAALALDTWNALLALSGEAAPASREIGWRDLPAELHGRHRASSSDERESLAVLDANSQIVLASADARIGGRVSLPRGEVVSAVLDALVANDAVVVTGEAGSGKSVVTSKVFKATAAVSLGLAFRAETLAESHLATSLHGFGGNLRHAMRLFALHPRKVLWVESAERLLEKDEGQREAFSDLLRIFTQTSGWKLLVTCRDYSVETFRSVFLERLGVRSEVVSVPRLTDEELNDAQRQLPALASPLVIPAIRQIVRNPFYLDLAARMIWLPAVPPPANVRAFRDKAWREVVCREDEAADGLPLERDRAMVEVALRRARALTPYVSAEDLPTRALQRLQRDSLLVHDRSDHTRFGPAHDVYEDWALLRWLQRLHDDERAMSAAFFDRVETHPAMRRAFRRWLTEMLECEPAEADRRVAEILGDLHIAQHWKDDALVAVLQSSEASAFLSRSGAQLLANDAELLRRAVHLLRVACRKVPSGVSPATRHVTLLMLPDGPAWEVMPVIVASALPQLKPTDILWILRFVEECVARRDLPGATAAAIGLTAKFLLVSASIIQHRHQRSFRERVLRVMLAVPHMVESELRAMLDKAFSDGRHDWEERTLPKLIWDHFTGDELCRHFPDMTLRVAELRLGFVPPSDGEEREARWRTYGRLEVPDVFGARGRTSMDDYPASAWQGAFAILLAHHPERGVELVLRLLNHACATYAGYEQDIIEKPVQVMLELEDGSQLPQWANWRLWAMYRGMNVATHTRESALMALEEWLLQKAARGDADTVTVFSRLLRESNNVAITAVLASVAIAYPYFIGAAAIPLLTCQPLFHWDFDRAFHDKANLNRTMEFIFPSIPDHMPFEHERRESGKREHRWRNLEHLCLQLQLTPARDKVRTILDGYLAALPAVDRQHDGHRQWRIMLHRMDARHFEVTQQTEEGVVWQAGGFAADLEEFRQRDMPAHRDREQRMGLFVWGMNVFTGENLNANPPTLWREKLAAARALPPEEDDTPRMLRRSGGPHISAVCLRDHWEDLTADERDWCIETVCAEVEAQPESDSPWHARVTPMDSLAPCAVIIPFLVARDTDPARHPRLVRCLARVALHPSDEAAQFAAHGIGCFLLTADRSLALGCVAAMVARVTELAAFQAHQRRLPWNEREKEEVFDAALLDRLRTSIEAGLSLDESALLSADYRRHPGLGVLLPLLSLFGEQPTDPLACKFYEHVATVSVASWRAERQRHRTGDGTEEEKDDLRYGPRYRVHQALARFALIGPESSAKAVVASLVAATHEQPKEAADFLKCLIVAEDQLQTGGRFWLFWEAFADAYIAHSLGARADDEHSDTAELLEVILLGIEWKADAREWKPLRGQSNRLRHFFQQLRASGRAVSSFTALVNRFASEFLPASLPLLAEKLAAQSPGGLLSRFTLMQLEEALSGLVYSGAVEVRRDPTLRSATMTILDCMVEAGSCAAFRIRDDFVTPLRS